MTIKRNGIYNRLTENLKIQSSETVDICLSSFVLLLTASARCSNLQARRSRR